MVRGPPAVTERPSLMVREVLAVRHGPAIVRRALDSQRAPGLSDGPGYSQEAPEKSEGPVWSRGQRGLNCLDMLFRYASADIFGPL